jgi:hypothetical protein
MSTDYYIIRGIPKKDILDKTDIKIINHPDGGDKEFLEDKYGNILHINPQMVAECEECEPILDINNIRELTRYGANNPTYIMDTLLKTFPFVFYGDNGWDTLVRMDEHDDSTFKKCIVEDMGRFGYKVIDVDNCVVEIPERTEKDYETEKSEPSKPLPPIGSTDQTYLSNLGNNGEELPF